jgi:hypothetical protein
MWQTQKHSSRFIRESWVLWLNAVSGVDGRKKRINYQQWRKKEEKAYARVWTGDLSITSRMRYHCATQA